jgi:hypothetical protein
MSRIHILTGGLIRGYLVVRGILLLLVVPPLIRWRARGMVIDHSHRPTNCLLMDALDCRCAQLPSNVEGEVGLAIVPFIAEIGTDMKKLPTAFAHISVQWGDFVQAAVLLKNLGAAADS